MANLKRSKSDAVDPLPGLAPWVGGKRNLARRLVARIEVIDHRTYAEPFVGMGGIFFRRGRRAANEVINDRARDVVNLFRVVRHHVDALVAELHLQLFSRAEFERLCATEPDLLTDVQRAARFYLLQRGRFSGRPDNNSFAVTPLRNKSIGRNALLEQMAAAHRRLERVTIECLDFREFLARYDTPRTLFYLDPPYWGCEHIYGKGLFQRSDFGDLAGILRRLRGQFILSLNDRPEIRDLFAWAHIEEEPVTYKFNGTKHVTELVISN